MDRRRGEWKGNMHKKMDDHSSGVGRWWRVFACILLAIGCLVGLAELSSSSAFTSVMHSVLEWFQHHRDLGAWVFLPFEAVWVIILLPTTPIELACGFIFGWKLGFVLDFVGKLTGCIIAFSAGRQCKGRVTRAEVLGESVRIVHALDQVFVADPRRGTRLLLLLQLAFLPVALKNYGLALTSVPTWVFAWTTAVGEVPGTLALVYSGASASKLIDTLDGSHHMATFQLTLLIVESVALLAVVSIVGYNVTRALRGFGNGSSEEVTGDTDPILSRPERSVSQEEGGACAFSLDHANGGERYHGNGVHGGNNRHHHGRGDGGAMHDLVRGSGGGDMPITQVDPAVTGNSVPLSSLGRPGRPRSPTAQRRERGASSASAPFTTHYAALGGEEEGGL